MATQIGHPTTLDWTHRKSKNTTLEWTAECQSAFEEIKALMAQDTLLAYPKYGKPFDVYMDTSNLQIGGVVSQEEKHIAFFSRKFNDAQTRYMTTEQELLAIVETLKNLGPCYWINS